MTLAITGSTGELGGRVARRLGELEVPQRLIVRQPARAPLLEGAELAVASSYGEETEMRAALEGMETLYFVSGREAADRLDQHRAVVKAAAAAGVERIVYVSCLGAAEEATFTFARQHWATELAIRDSGLAFTFLRSSLYLDFMPLFGGADGVIRGPAGDGRLAAVSRDDLAEAAVAVLTSAGEHDGKTYDLTGPELLDLAETAERLRAHAGAEIRYEPETLEQAWDSRRPLGAPDWEIEGWISSYLAIADGSFAVLSDALEQLTGRPPQTLEGCLEAHPELLGDQAVA